MTILERMQRMHRFIPVQIRHWGRLKAQQFTQTSTIIANLLS
jgi:hypothetical protein